MEQPQTDSKNEVEIQLRAMIDLQSIDDEINILNKQINKLDEKTHDEEAHVNEKKADLDKIRVEVEKLLKDKRDAEVTSKTLQEDVSKLNGQMYDVKTNEALRALQDEVKRKKEENSILEERIIEMMLAEDEIKVDVKKAEEALKEAEGLLAKAKQASDQEKEGLEDKVKDFKSQWEEASQKVNKHLLERYVKLRDARDGMALARVENDTCTGCRMAIPPQMFIELKKYRQIHSCSNCARILFAD